MRRNTTQRILSATTSALVDKGGVGQLARSAHTAEDLQPDLYRQGDLAFRTVNSQSPHPRRHPKQGRAAHHHNSINSQTTLARRHAELMSAMKMEGLPTVVMANADDRAVHVHVTDTSNKNRSSTTSLTSTKDQLVVKSQAYLETLVADLLVLQKGLSPPQPRARVPQAGKETDIECTAVGYNDNKDGNSTLMVTSSSLSSTSHEAVKQLRSIVERKKSNNSNKLGNNGNFLSARSRMNTEEFAAMRSKSKLSVYTSEDGSGSHGFDEHPDQVERSQIGREQNPPSGSRTPYFSGGFYGSSPLNEHGSHQQVVFANHEERGDHPTRQSAEKMGDIQNMGEPSSELVDLLGSLCRGTLTEETTLAAEAAVALATATPSSRIVRKLGEMSTPALVTAFSIVNAKNPHALALLKDFLLQVPCCPPHRIIPPSTINKTTSVADRLLGLLYDQSSMSAFHLTISAKAMGMLHAHQPSAEEADAEREARELRETTNRDLDATSEINQHLHTEESSPFRNVNNNINNNNNNDGHIGAPMLPFFNDDPLLSLEYEHRPLLRWAVAKHYAAAGDWQRVLTVLSTQRGEDSEQEYLAATLFSKKLTSSLKNEIESAQIAGEALSDNKNTKRTTMTATRPSVQLCESERGLVFLAVFLSKASLKLTTAQQWTQLMKFITDVERSEQGEGKEREQVRKEEHYTPTATIASAKRNKQGKTLPALISACVSSPSLDGVSALELKAILTATGCPGNVARHFLTASSKRKISLCKILQSIQESNNAHTRSSSPTQRTTTREGQSGEQQRTKDATSSSCGGGDDALSQSAMDVMTVLLFRFAVTTHRSSQFDAEDYLRATEALARIVKMFGDSDHEEVLTKKHNDSSNREQTQNDMMGYEYLGFLPNPSSLSPLGASMIMKDIEAVIRGLDGILSTSQLSHRNHRASTRARNGGSREAHGMTMNSAEDYSIRHGQSSACAVTADYLVGALFDLWRQGHSVLPIIKRKTNTKASVAAREVHYCSGGPTPFALGRKQWEFISSLALRSMTSPASLTVGCQQKLCCNVYAKVLAVAANIGDPTTAFDAFMAIVMHHTLVRHTRTSVVGNSRASGTTAEEEDEIVAQGASLLIEPMVLISESRGNPQQWRPSCGTENWLLEFFVQHAHEMSPHGSEGRSRTALLLDMILENSRRVMSHVMSTNLDDGSAEKRVVDLIAHCAPSHLIVKLVETLLCQSRRDLINTADRVGRRGKYSFSSGNVKWTPFEYLCRLSRTMRALSTNVNLLVSSETPPHQGGGENGKGTGVNSAHAQHVCKLLPAVLDNLVPLIEAPLRDLGEHEGPAATHCGSNNNGPIDALIMQLEISLNALRGAFPSLFDAVAPIALMCVTRASRAPRSISSSTTITIPYSGNNQSSAVPVSNTHDRVCLSDAQLSFGTKLLEHCLQSPRCQDSLIDRIIVPTESLLYVTEQQRVRLGLEPWTAAHKSNALVCGTATTEQPLIVNAAQNILATHLVVGSWAEGLRVHRSLMGTKEFTGEAEGEAARPTDCRLISSLLSRSSRLTVPLHEKVIWPKFFSEVVDALASHHLRQTAVAELYSRVTLAFGSMACEESSSPNRGQLAGIRSPLQLSSDSSPKWALAFKAFRDITSKPQDRDTVIATLRDGRRDGIETLVRLSDVILLCMEKCGVSKIEIEALSKELQVTTTSGQAQEQENGDVETKIKATTPDHRQGNAVQKPSLGTEADVNNESSQTHNHDVYGEGIPKLPSAIGNKNSNNGNVSSVGTQNNYYPKPTTRNSNGMSLSASLYQSSFRAVAHSDPSKALAVYTRELREETRPSMVTLAAAAKACSVQAHKCWAQSLALLRQAALSSRKGQPPAEMIATTLKTLIDAGRWKEASSLCQKVNRASRDAASANYHNELGHGDEGRRDGKSKNNSHHNNDGHSQGVGILGTPRHAYSNSLTLREAVGLSWAKTYVGSDADRVDAVLLMADITIKCLVLAKAWDEAVNQFYSLIVNGVSVSAPTDKGFVLRRRYVHPSPTTIRAALDACAHASALVRQSTANVLNFAGALEDLVCVGGELLRHVIRVVAEAEAESKRNFIAAPADEELAGAREIDNNRAGEAWAWGCGCPLLLDINRNARFVVKNEQHTLLGGKQVRVGGQEIERNGSLFSAGLDGDDLIWFNGHRYDHFSRLFCDPLHVAL